MSTATNGTGLRSLNPAERKAVELRKRGALDSAIRIETGLEPAEVDIAVKRHGEWEKLQPRAATDAAMSARPSSYLTTTALLTWAKASGLTRAMTIAARVDEYVAELRNLHAQNDARTKAQADVDRLTAELAAAKAALRNAGAVVRGVRPAGTKPDDERREQLAAIRAWAPGAGYEVSPLGRIPKDIVDAYNTAHGTQVQA